MSSPDIHMAGIFLESIVADLHATLKGLDASNHADYYDYEKGVFDGLASCLESIQLATEIPAVMPNGPGTLGGRFSGHLRSAIEALRLIDPSVEDPDRQPQTVTAFVATVGALAALSQFIHPLAINEGPSTDLDEGT